MTSEMTDLRNAINAASDAAVAAIIALPNDAPARKRLFKQIKVLAGMLKKADRMIARGAND